VRKRVVIAVLGVAFAGAPSARGASDLEGRAFVLWGGSRESAGVDLVSRTPRLSVTGLAVSGSRGSLFFSDPGAGRLYEASLTGARARIIAGAGAEVGPPEAISPSILRWTKNGLAFLDRSLRGEGGVRGERVRLLAGGGITTWAGNGGSAPFDKLPPASDRIGVPRDDNGRQPPGEGQHAADAPLGFIRDFWPLADGSLLFAQEGTRLVRRVGRNGKVSTLVRTRGRPESVAELAGSPIYGQFVEGNRIESAQWGVVTGLQGRRLRVLAGGVGAPSQAGNPRDARQAYLYAATSLLPDTRGGFFLASGAHVFHVTASGRLRHVAGRGDLDTQLVPHIVGARATRTQLPHILQLARAPDGGVLLSTIRSGRTRRDDPYGIVVYITPREPDLLAIGVPRRQQEGTLRYTSTRAAEARVVIATATRTVRRILRLRPGTHRLAWPGAVGRARLTLRARNGNRRYVVRTPVRFGPPRR